MNEEIIVQNVTPDENSAQPNHNGKLRRSSTGKIARLPNDIREQLNQRLLDGHPVATILPWLNGLPPVKEILAAHFHAAPVNKQNVFAWCRTGYQDWLKEWKSIARLERACQYASKIPAAARGKIAEGASALISCHILELFDHAATGQHSPGDLAKMAFAVSALQTADQNKVRLKYEKVRLEHDKTRVFQGNEQLVLAWDKFLRPQITTVQRALNDAIAKDVQAADIDNGEKIELLGYQLFGKKWQGREVPVPKEPPSHQKPPEPPNPQS